MKKTNKSNPLKFFNDNKEMAYKKAGGEMAKFKKSLKKFQGLEDSEVNMMVNKPGSTGGYKKPSNPLIGFAGMMDPTRAMQEASRSARSVADMNPSNPLNTRAASLNVPSSRSNQLENYGISPYKQKRGGAVKTKKRK